MYLRCLEVVEACSFPTSSAESLNRKHAYTVDMESLIYFTAKDYNDRPKPILASLIGTTFVIFYKIHGHDILSSCVFTFVSVEIFIRILCAIALANL